MMGNLFVISLLSLFSLEKTELKEGYSKPQQRALLLFLDPRGKRAKACRTERKEEDARTPTKQQKIFFQIPENNKSFFFQIRAS